MFFKSKTQHGIELDVCTVHMKADLKHAQLTRGPDSGPRNRILPDLVFSSPFPSPIFLSSNRQNEIWGRDQIVMINFEIVSSTMFILNYTLSVCMYMYVLLVSLVAMFYLRKIYILYKPKQDWVLQFK